MFRQSLNLGSQNLIEAIKEDSDFFENNKNGTAANNMCNF